MRDIELDEAELALWNEVGPRGDAFRASVRDRASNQVNETGAMVEVLDAHDTVLDAVDAGAAEADAASAVRPDAERSDD